MLSTSAAGVNQAKDSGANRIADQAEQELFLALGQNLLSCLLFPHPQIVSSPEILAITYPSPSLPPVALLVCLRAILSICRCLFFTSSFLFISETCLSEFLDASKTLACTSACLSTCLSLAASLILLYFVLPVNSKWVSELWLHLTFAWELLCQPFPDMRYLSVVMTNFATAIYSYTV